MRSEYDLSSNLSGDLFEGTPHRYRVTFTLMLDDGHSWDEVSPEFAECNPAEGHAITYELPAISRRLAEEYAEMRLSRDTRNMSRDHMTIACDVECDDPTRAIGDDFREEMLDVLDFYIKRGLNNDEIVETLDAALAEMKA